ncbi:MAG: 3-phosphoshikimate 1-carboxyvinyltransferase, partial [Phycisphaerales bacterium]|nr:3-phosphoshikimate 1-carboxyvinyltransferase [Phycisphaerales bacterium]
MPLEDFARLLQRPLGRMPDPLPLRPVPQGERFRLRVRPPGSKSITNRALLLAALADGESTLDGALTDAEDAQVMAEALQTLGARLKIEGDSGRVRVRGVGGRWRVGEQGVTLALENAGTATRFLAASAILADGPVTIDGSERMRQRPIGELASSLEALGARVEFLGAPGCPPLRITPPAERPRRADLTLPTVASGQFVSALLMLGPWLPRGLGVRIDGEPTSAPYILMTLRLLDRLGAESVEASGDARSLRVGAGPIAPFHLDIEPDASGATYFWAAAAMVRGSQMVVPGLSMESLQGDVRFARTLGAMDAGVDERRFQIGVSGTGSLFGVDADFSDMPDAAMTLAAVACVAKGPTVIRGLRTLRVKESDRLEALRAELSKIGAGVTIEGDALRIAPPSPDTLRHPEAPAVHFETYNDHRMAMALALIR